jgi:hypothetical protein
MPAFAIAPYSGPRHRAPGGPWAASGALAVLLFLAGCANLPGPTAGLVPTREYAGSPLPNCRPEHDRPETWLAKWAEPDRERLTPAQIAQLNRGIARDGLVANVFAPTLSEEQIMEPDRPESENAGGTRAPAGTTPLVSGGVLEAQVLYLYLKDETERIKAVPRYDAWSRPLPPEFFRPLDENLNLDAIRDRNRVRYAITRRRTDARYYPTYSVVVSQPAEPEFDVLQVSSLPALRPLAVLHTSRDGRWVFAVSPLVRGWVWRDDVAFGAPADLTPFLEPPRRLVVLAPAVTAAWQPGDPPTAGEFPMGTSLPLEGDDGQYYRVSLPDEGPEGRLVSRPGFIPHTEDVREGFLPYTSRNLCTQAFRLLHTPYRWGGRDRFRDCSQFVLDVYACMGVDLPRNSGSQALAGSGRTRLDKGLTPAQRQAVLARQPPFTLLQFPGHIMLYLGRDWGRDYVIHDIWSYRKPTPGSPGVDRQVVVGRVVVSDLSLGEGSTRTSLLDRLTNVTVLRP